MSTSRSPKFPSIGLAEALDLTSRLWQQARRSSVGQAIVAQAWGHKSVSGPVKRKIGSLRQYGLLDGRGGDVQLTERAVTICAHPEDSAERIEAIRAAALTPELFRLVQESYRDAADNVLAAHLVTKLGFNPKAAEDFVAAFRQTFELVGAGQDESDEVTYPSNENPQADDANVAPSVIVSRPQVTSEFREDKFDMEEGSALLRWPGTLSHESYLEFADWLDLVKRKAERTSKKNSRGNE